MKTLGLSRVRQALIIAPHPDDETIGAYGLIRALKARSTRVRILVVTDGAGSHRTSPLWPRTRLVAERMRETRAAMHRIGIAADDVTFLRLPDGELTASTKAVRRALHRAVSRGAWDLLVMPAVEDDHPDHRTVAAALPRTSARRLHYLVWPNRQVAPRPASHCLRLGQSVAAKRGAIMRYRTQTGAITDDPAGFTISRNVLADFARPVERFREVR